MVELESDPGQVMVPAESRTDIAPTDYKRGVSPRCLTLELTTSMWDPTIA